MDSQQTLSISPANIKLAEKIRTDRVFRARFFRAVAQETIASQIRYLRESRHMRQTDLAQDAGMKQSAISRLESADYSKWNFATLIRIADALDARLKITLEPWEDVVSDLTRNTRERSAIGEMIAATPGSRSASAVALPRTLQETNLMPSARRAMAGRNLARAA